MASNSMVAHKWAHAQAAKGSNFQTDGQRLQSYNTTVGWNTGRGLIFLCGGRMTPSTGKQLSYARRAVVHLDVVLTHYFQYGHNVHTFNEKEAFKMACDALTTDRHGLTTAKLSKFLNSRLTHSDDAAAHLCSIATRYGLEVPVFEPFTPAYLERARVYAEAAETREAETREARRVRDIARAVKQRAHDLQQFESWHNGEATQLPWSYHHDENGGYYIAVFGDKVVTSGGAECPVDHARRGIEFWKSRVITACTCGHDDGYAHTTCPKCVIQSAREFTPWQKNGHRVQLGTFQLDRIDADGTAYAGCHKFNIAELDRLADKLL